MIAYALAAAVVLVCGLLLLRLCLGWKQQQRFDAVARRMGHACRRAAYAVQRKVLRLWRWRSSRRHAARMAEEAIRRARNGVTREGNVYKPKSFRGPRKPH